MEVRMSIYHQQWIMEQQSGAQVQIALVGVGPVGPHGLEALLALEGAAGASVAGEDPLDLVVECEDGLHEEVGGGVVADDDEDHPPVAVLPLAPVGNHQVHVDQHVPEDAVVEQPAYHKHYHEATNLIFSFSYFLAPEAAKAPLVPHDTSSMLQKAWTTMVIVQAPWQLMQLIWSRRSLPTQRGWVKRWRRSRRKQMPRLMRIMTRMLICEKFELLTPLPSRFRQMPTTLQLTSPTSANVNSPITIEIQRAQLIQELPMSDPATATRQKETKRTETMRAMAKMQVAVTAICRMVVKMTQKRRAGEKQVVTRESMESSMARLSRRYLSMALCYDCEAWQWQFFHTQRKANMLLLIHRLRCFSKSQCEVIGSVLAIALGTYFKQYFSLGWQQMPRLRMRSSAKYILASLKSFSSMFGFSSILKQLCSSRFGSYLSDFISALYLQADHAPGSTCRNPNALSAFLSKKCETMYSYSCALSTEKNALLSHYISPPFASSVESDSCDFMELSTVINPVTPPTSSSVNPLRRLGMASFSGLVPTSRSMTNWGLRQRQKPWKNQRWEESLVPLVCLKQLNSLRQSLVSLVLPSLLVMLGFQRF